MLDWSELSVFLSDHREFHVRYGCVRSLFNRCCQVFLRIGHCVERFREHVKAAQILVKYSGDAFDLLLWKEQDSVFLDDFRDIIVSFDSLDVS